MSIVVDIARAVADELNVGVFTQPFQAVRAYLPQYKLSDMDTLHVTVVPRAMEVGAASRGKMQYECKVDVAVQKRCDPDDTGTLDALMDLSDEIVAYLAQRRLLRRLSGTTVARM